MVCKIVTERWLDLEYLVKKSDELKQLEPHLGEETSNSPTEASCQNNRLVGRLRNKI